MQSYAMISIIIQTTLPSEIQAHPIINRVYAYLQDMMKEHEKNPRANVGVRVPLPLRFLVEGPAGKSGSS